MRKITPEEFAQLRAQSLYLSNPTIGQTYDPDTAALFGGQVGAGSEMYLPAENGGFRSMNVSQGPDGYTIDNEQTGANWNDFYNRHFKESKFDKLAELGVKAGLAYMTGQVASGLLGAGASTASLPTAGEGFTLDASMLDPTSLASGVPQAAQAGITAAQADMAAHLASSVIPGTASTWAQAAADSPFTFPDGTQARSLTPKEVAELPTGQKGLLDYGKDLVNLAKDNPTLTKVALSAAGGLLGAQGPSGNLGGGAVNNVGPGGNTFVPQGFKWDKPQGSSAYTGGLLFGGRR